MQGAVHLGPTFCLNRGDQALIQGALGCFGQDGLAGSPDSYEIDKSESIREPVSICL